MSWLASLNAGPSESHIMVLNIVTWALVDVFVQGMNYSDKIFHFEDMGYDELARTTGCEIKRSVQNEHFI